MLGPSGKLFRSLSEPSRHARCLRPCSACTVQDPRRRPPQFTGKLLNVNLLRQLLVSVVLRRVLPQILLQVADYRWAEEEQAEKVTCATKRGENEMEKIEK